MRSRYRFWSAAVLLGTACDGISTVSELPATVSLEVGDEIRLPDRNLTFVLEEVVEDSRCPVNAVCVWEGRVMVRLTVIRPDPPNTEILVDSQQPAVIDSVRLRIVQVSPARFADVPIDQEDYRISFEIDQAPQ